MRKQSVTSFCLALATFAATIASAQAAQNDATRALKTPSGLSYAYRPISDAKRVAILITWPTKFSLVPKGQEGLPFVAAKLMLLGGADGRQSNELKSEFADLDSQFGINAQPDFFSVMLAAPIENGVKAAGLANSVLLKPNLGQEWLKRTKSVFLQQAAQQRSSVLGKSLIVAQQYAMGGHPYARVEPFYPDSVITSIDHRAVVDWHRRALVRQGMKIVATGQGDPKQIGQTIDRFLEGLPGGSGAAQENDALPDFHLDGKTIVLEDPKAKKSVIIMFGEIPWAKTLADARSNLAVRILGEGPNARLFNELRTALGLSYRVTARTTQSQGRKRFVAIQGEFENAQITKAVDAMHQTYDMFVSGGVNDKELAAVRDQTLLKFDKAMKVPMSAAGAVMVGRIAGFEDGVLDRVKPYLMQTKSDEMSAHIASFFPRRENMLTVVVTPSAAGIAADCTIRSVDEVAACRPQL